MNAGKLTIEEVEALIKNVLMCENNVIVESVVPNLAGEYCTVILNGDVNLSTLNAIAKAVGDEPIIGGEDYNKINLFFRIPNENDINTGEDDEPELEKKSAPAISDELRHKDEFYDSKDMVIPGTEMNCSNTEQCEKIKAWMKETGHIPIIYIRLEDGLHVEISNLYDCKARNVLSHSEAVGGDAHIYKIENPDELFPIGSSICVRATCIDTGHSDVYDLNFFV